MTKETKLFIYFISCEFIVVKYTILSSLLLEATDMTPLPIAISEVKMNKKIILFMVINITSSRVN